MTNNKGITLIALVITIIIILILTSVSINYLIGKEGLLSTVFWARDAQQTADELERIRMAVMSGIINEDLTLTTEILKEELLKENENGILIGNGDWIYKGEENYYKITKNGEVSIANSIFNIYGNTQEKYQQIEYIEKDIGYGNLGQYINTGVNVNSNNFENIRFIIDEDIEENQGWLLSGSSDITQNAIYVGVNGKTFYYGVGNDVSTGVQYQTANPNRCIYDLDVKNNKYKVIDSQTSENYVEQAIKTNKNAFNTNGLPLYIMSYSGENRGHKTKLYGAQIFLENDLIRNFIPCYSITDNKIGMWDTVNEVFYENAGTGEFIKGTNKNSYIYDSVGDKNEEGKYEIPIKIKQTDGEIMINVKLDEPLRKVGDAVDYIDLVDKKVVRYIKKVETIQVSSYEEKFEILVNPIEESINIDTIDFNKVKSLEVNTSISPSNIIDWNLYN